MSKKSSKRVDYHQFTGEEVKALIKAGFEYMTFLNAHPGEGQTVEYKFDFDTYSGPTVHVTITTEF